MSQPQKQSADETLTPPAKGHEAGAAKGTTTMDASQENKPGRKLGRRRGTAARNTKFVLPRLDGDHKVQIEKEYASEQEAMLASCHSGRPYWVIEQFSAYAVIDGKFPVIKKKPSDTELEPAGKPLPAGSAGR